MTTEYLDAPSEINDMAARLIKKFRLIHASEAKIKYVFKFSKASHELGYCSRSTGHWRFLIDFDFVIVLWSDWWAEAPPEEQEALLYHNLLHINRNQNTGFWEIRKHPIEAFPEELAAYGAWHPSLKDLKAILKKKSK